IAWHAGDQRKLVGSKRKDKAHGTWCNWHENGKLSAYSEWSDGTWLKGSCYDKDGNKLETEVCWPPQKAQQQKKAEQADSYAGALLTCTNEEEHPKCKSLESCTLTCPAGAAIEKDLKERVVSCKKDGHKEGPVIAWHAGDQRKLVGSKRKDKAHGTWCNWHENGKLSAYSEWSDDIWLKGSCYDKDGNKLETEVCWPPQTGKDPASKKAQQKKETSKP
ncbi:MAG: hypothetical protein VYE15_03925, partial [Myxococcota bacterium]|nr:hypothetical protein [Myxococcota bacterium]